MSDITHKMAMDAIGMAAQILTPNNDAYMALVKAEQSMHSSLHIVDPTLYMQAMNSDSLRHQVTLCKAALAFIKAVQGVKNELAEKAGTP